MPIALSSPGKIYQQNEKIHLSNGEHYRSTKSLQNKPGRWYFEFTHYSGENFHLAGFECEGGSFDFYICRILTNPHFYLSSSFKTDQNVSIPFVFQNEHTVGLGIDTYKHIFYVYYDKYFASYNLNKTTSMRKLNARILGAYSEYTNEEVSVNFGASPFKYNISGFTPWEYNHEEKTCYHNKKNQINPLLNIFIFTFSS